MIPYWARLLTNPFPLAVAAHRLLSWLEAAFKHIEENGMTGIGTYIIGLHCCTPPTIFGPVNLIKWASPLESHSGDQKQGACDISTVLSVGDATVTRYNGGTCLSRLRRALNTRDLSVRADEGRCCGAEGRRQRYAAPVLLT
jgi:hypothetical protein